MEKYITENTEIKYHFKEGISKDQIIEVIDDKITNYTLYTNTNTKETDAISVYMKDKDLTEELLKPFLKKIIV